MAPLFVPSLALGVASNTEPEASSNFQYAIFSVSSISQFEYASAAPELYNSVTSAALRALDQTPISSIVPS